MKTKVLETTFEWDEEKAADALNGLYPRGWQTQRKGKHIMATVRKVVSSKDKLTREQKKRIRQAAKQSITYDEDAPALTEKQLKELAEQARAIRKQRNKPVVSLRISPDTLNKAKATGVGYTGFLSRLLDNAINDPEMVKKSL